MSEMQCKRCGAAENRIYGFCSIECRTAWEYEDDIRDLTARIAELEEKQRWIPVSESLPDNWKPVMTIDMSESTRIPVPAFYDPETSLWSTHLPNYDLLVTHWMPLPEPLDGVPFVSLSNEEIAAMTPEHPLYKLVKGDRSK